MTAGSCWAQQTEKSANTPSASSAQAAAAKDGKGKAGAKSAAKATKVAKSAQTKQDKSKTQSASKAGGDKTDKADKADKSDKASAAQKPELEAKHQDKTDAKPRTVAEKSDTRTADLTPPPGTMMGAYGQSLMRTASVASVAGGTHPALLPQPAAAINAQGGTLSAGTPAVASVAAAQNSNAGTPSITAANTMMAPIAPALPATAMMGAAAGTSNDVVTRFLQQRGIVAQAQAQTEADTAAMAGNPSLLNEVRDRASNLVLSAMNFLGVPYRRGGNSVSNGFDCSGFTRHIFEMSVGLVLPRRADEQAKMSSLISIKKEDLKPGDLVFFNTMRATFSHVGIYVGEGKFIHSPRAGGAVRVEDMREAYWAKRFTGARRADLTQAPNT